MMKKSFLKLALIVPALAGLCFMSFTSDAPYSKGITLADDAKGIVFDKLVHDFGTIAENGGTVAATFTVTNNTNEAILLTEVKPSCGCTVADWTKEPIEPGKKGTVKATYNPKGHPGPFNKTIAVTTTTNERFTLQIKGTVEVAQ